MTDTYTGYASSASINPSLTVQPQLYHPAGYVPSPTAPGMGASDGGALVFLGHRRFTYGATHTAAQAQRELARQQNANTINMQATPPHLIAPRVPTTGMPIISGGPGGGTVMQVNPPTGGQPPGYNHIINYNNSPMTGGFWGQMNSAIGSVFGSQWMNANTHNFTHG